MKYIIAAVDQEWGIGKEGNIPWYFKEDFEWFKTKTKGATLIMGRITYEEIAKKFKYPDSGRFLPGRTSYVISSSDIPSNENIKHVHSIEEAIADSQNYYPDKPIFFIGGNSVFTKALSIVDEVFLTFIPGNYECDVFFPKDEMTKVGFYVAHRELCETSTGDNLDFYTCRKK